MAGSIVPNPLDLSNTAFLQAIFGDEWERAHVCSFSDDPSKLEEEGKGHLWSGGPAGASLPWMHAPENQFFCISLFSALQRRKQVFDECYCIVVDDVGIAGSAKIPPANVELLLGSPSWQLETSPGNEQWGYLLDAPISSRPVVEEILQCLIQQFGGEDPGMAGVTRYVRLPEGSNTKAKYVGPSGRTFSCRLTFWCPDAHLGVFELLRNLNINPAEVEARAEGAYAVPLAPGADPVLHAIASLGMLTGEKPNGTYDITCPWIDTHTDRVASGTSYFSPEGFKCHHGHCQHRTFRDLRVWLEEEAGQHITEARALQATTDFADLLPVTVDIVPESSIWQRIGDISPCLDDAGVVRGLIASNSFVVLYGDSNTGKSFLAMDLAVSVATGAPFFDRSTLPGPVAYIAAEGGAGARNRFTALRQERERSSHPIPAGAELYVAMQPFLLDSVADMSQITSSIDDFDRPPTLIVVDTLSRSLSGDENAAADMGLFIQACDALRARYGAAVLVVHHSGKDASKGARGSSSLRAAVDTELLVTAGENGRYWHVKKQRDFEQAEPQAFSLKPVVVGANPNTFEEVTSCVIESVSGRDPADAAYDRSVDLTPAKLSQARRVWQALESGAIETEDWIGVADEPGEVGCVVDVFADRIIELSPELQLLDRPAKRREAVAKGVGDLIASRLLRRVKSDGQLLLVPVGNPRVFVKT